MARASLCIQITVTIAKRLFATVGTVDVTGLHMGNTAVVVLALTQPVFTGWFRREWTGIVAHGAAMVAMNVLFDSAVANLPLASRRWSSSLAAAPRSGTVGVAVTFNLTDAATRLISPHVVSGAVVTWLAGGRCEPPAPQSNQSPHPA